MCVCSGVHVYKHTCVCACIRIRGMYVCVHMCAVHQACVCVCVCVCVRARAGSVQGDFSSSDKVQVEAVAGLVASWEDSAAAAAGLGWGQKGQDVAPPPRASSALCRCPGLRSPRTVTLAVVTQLLSRASFVLEAAASQWPGGGSPERHPPARGLCTAIPAQDALPTEPQGPVL